MIKGYGSMSSKDVNFKLLASKWETDNASFYSSITPSNDKKQLNADIFNRIESSKTCIIFDRQLN